MATLRINGDSKQAQALLEFVKTFSFVEIIDEETKTAKVEKSTYDPEFVKMIKDAEMRGDYKTIDPANLWESLGLK